MTKPKKTKTGWAITCFFLEPCENCGGKEFHFIGDGLMFPLQKKLLMKENRSTNDVAYVDLRCCECGEEIESELLPREDVDIRIVCQIG